MSRVWLRNGLVSLPELSRRLRCNGDCLEWTGAVDRKGYGLALVANKSVRVHRLAYELFVGPFDRRLQILHSCDNKRCCSPDHLRPGTNAENMRDKADRAAIKNRKLDKEKLLTVRSLHASGHSGRSIARQFGVSHNVVNKVLRGLAYRGAQFE